MHTKLIAIPPSPLQHNDCLSHEPITPYRVCVTTCVVMGYHVVVDLLELCVVRGEELERLGYGGHGGGGGTDLRPKAQQAL